MNTGKNIENCLQRCEQLGVTPTPFIFAASVETQSAQLFEQNTDISRVHLPVESFDTSDHFVRKATEPYRLKRGFCISTSKFGIGQIAGSNRTPLGLHRIAEKIGDGCEPGTVFKSRRAIGHLRDGLPLESITTRILWLEGLEEGFNRGGNVDTHARYIYIHGFGDQKSLGKPASLGCIHLADGDLIELYDLLPVGTLVWISE